MTTLCSIPVFSVRCLAHATAADFRWKLILFPSFILIIYHVVVPYYLTSKGQLSSPCGLRCMVHSGRTLYLLACQALLFSRPALPWPCPPPPCREVEQYRMQGLCQTAQHHTTPVNTRVWRLSLPGGIVSVVAMCKCVLRLLCKLREPVARLGKGCIRYERHSQL
jgi:hypothetical protein